MSWSNPSGVPSRAYTCGHCGREIASSVGFPSAKHGIVYVCSHCVRPTYFDIHNNPTPGVAFGSTVGHLPNDILALYDEARRCTSTGAYTAAVLLCRKLLMNVAVAHGAKPGDAFIAYVTYLADKGYVPPNGRGWVDHIRQKGNEATHEIALMTEQDAKDLIQFSEMLLKFIFEFPNKVPAPPKPAATP